MYLCGTQGDRTPAVSQSPCSQSAERMMGFGNTARRSDHSWPPTVENGRLIKWNKVWSLRLSSYPFFHPLVFDLIWFIIGSTLGEKACIGLFGWSGVCMWLGLGRWCWDMVGIRTWARLGWYVSRGVTPSLHLGAQPGCLLVSYWCRNWCYFVGEMVFLVGFGFCWFCWFLGVVVVMIAILISSAFVVGS